MTHRGAKCNWERDQGHVKYTAGFTERNPHCMEERWDFLRNTARSQPGALGAGTGREGTKHRGKEMLRVSLGVVASAAGNLIPGTRAVRSQMMAGKGGFALRVCSSP